MLFGPGESVDVPRMSRDIDPFLEHHRNWHSLREWTDVSCTVEIGLWFDQSGTIPHRGNEQHRTESDEVAQYVTKPLSHSNGNVTLCPVELTGPGRNVFHRPIQSKVSLRAATKLLRTGTPPFRGAVTQSRATLRVRKCLHSLTRRVILNNCPSG